ncbi:MAG: tetratricopeptide repeat protein [Gemmatimonadaceae bacterium]
MSTTVRQRIRWLLFLCVVPTALAAQGLRLKPALAGAGATGCAAFPAPNVTSGPVAAAADAEARQLLTTAQDAALLGEHAAARDAFARAARLTPGNARLSYYLGREHEALADASAAVAAYCRYLALAPNAPDGDEVRGRVVRLVPSTDLARMDVARSTFLSGVALLERRQYTEADSAFASVAKALPSAPESYFNRALARAARGNRQPALDDFEKYLELSPTANDRVAVRSAMSRVPDGVYSPRAAFGSGLLIPGLGQMSTGRPFFGVLTLGAASGALVFGLQTKAGFQVGTFADPFGTPYVDSIPTTSRPNLVAAGIGAAAIWLGGALEASAFARRSRARAEAIFSRELPRQERRISLQVDPSSRGVNVGMKIETQR